MFFPYSLKAEYEQSGIWPDDGIDVNEDLFFTYTNPPAGKIRVVDGHNLPYFVDIPPLTKDEQIASADAIKMQLVASANDFMNSRQWPGKAAIGRLKGEELQQYSLWLDYLDALEAVDTSSALDINWPVSPTQ